MSGHGKPKFVRAMLPSLNGDLGAMMETLTCRNCGHASTEAEPVERPFEYVGGQGYTRTGPFCTDMVACWGRVDQGFKGAAGRK